MTILCTYIIILLFYYIAVVLYTSNQCIVNGPDAEDYPNNHDTKKSKIYITSHIIIYRYNIKCSYFVTKAGISTHLLRCFSKLILCDDRIVTNLFYVILNEDKKVYFAFFEIF